MIRFNKFLLKELGPDLFYTPLKVFVIGATFSGLSFWSFLKDVAVGLGILGAASIFSGAIVYGIMASVYFSDYKEYKNGQQ